MAARDECEVFVRTIVGRDCDDGGSRDALDRGIDDMEGLFVIVLELSNFGLWYAKCVSVIASGEVTGWVYILSSLSPEAVSFFSFCNNGHREEVVVLLPSRMFCSFIKDSISLSPCITVPKLAFTLLLCLLSIPTFILLVTHSFTPFVKHI